MKSSNTEKPAESSSGFGWQFMSSMLDTIGIILVVLDEEGKIIFLNKSGEKATGFSLLEVAGKHFWDKLLSSESRQTAKDEFLRIGKDDLQGNHSASWIMKDGSVKEMGVSEPFLYELNEDQKFFLCLAADCEDKSRPEKFLWNSGGYIASIIENSFDISVIIDREGNIVYINNAVETVLGHNQEELLGKSVFEFVHSEDIETVKRNMKTVIKRPITNKFLELRIMRKGGSWVYAECFGVPIEDIGGSVNFLGYARDITKKRMIEEQLRASLRRTERNLRQTIKALSAMGETRDPYTAGHQEKVADISAAIATEMGLSSDIMQGITTAALLHDIGKISVPAELLSRPGRLDETEINYIRRHVVAGYEILKNISFPWPVAEAVLQHHERIDGSGYPYGLKGEEMLLEAKVIAVADTLESIAFHRPYRAARGMEEALEELRLGAGSIYDFEVVKACLSLFEDKGFALE